MLSLAAGLTGAQRGFAEEVAWGAMMTAPEARTSAADARGVLDRRQLRGEIVYTARDKDGRVAEIAEGNSPDWK